ncbi:hypothetical protein [Caulobacter sp. BK020]|uniref:hypothetical protein n=1 Tax=Caulobacter sp. BK020 TaxID=2512117 RepID=UPI00104C524B|nr:hypothetical protein [Caulobacter sp. BK020]
MTDTLKIHLLHRPDRAGDEPSDSWMSHRADTQPAIRHGAAAADTFSGRQLAVAGVAFRKPDGRPGERGEAEARFRWAQAI